MGLVPALDLPDSCPQRTEAGIAAMRLLHFGFKVRDIDRTMEASNELFGINWDRVAEFALPRGADDAQLGRTKVAQGQTGGGVEIELVQYARQEAAFFDAHEWARTPAPLRTCPTPTSWRASSEATLIRPRAAA